MTKNNMDKNMEESNSDEIDDTNINKINIPEKAFTHSGKFHSDDVFSAALLTYLNPNIQIIRDYSIPKDFDGIVFDIGGGSFDHHQKGALVRDNGIPYAAFGLLWKEFGLSILSTDDAESFDKSFIQPLDYSDNTGERNDLAEIISLFNPRWDEDKDTDICFNEAKDIAFKILTNKIEMIKSINRAKDFVFESIKKAKGNIAVLSTRAPWKNFINGTDIEFVVYPSDRGGYNAQGVPKTVGNNELKISFPQEWRGKTAKELKDITGIETLSFCHNSGFLISAGKLEDIIEACKLAQKEASHYN